MLHGAFEFNEIFGGHIIDTAEVRCHARFKPTRAHREGTIFFFFEIDHRAMPREQEFGRDRCAASHQNGFFDRTHRLPCALIFVLHRVGRIGFIDIKVFLIDAKNGQTKRDGVVVADGNARQCRFAGANHIEPRRAQMRDVAQRRCRESAMRIVGQNGAPGGRF